MTEQTSMKFHPLIALFFLALPLPLPLPLLKLKLPGVLGELQSDREALLDFAAAFPHAQKLKWNQTAPLCTSWVGIVCDANATNVVALRLPGVGLYGSIPPNTIGKLRALRVLSLRSNMLAGNLPSDIPSLPSLRALFLQYNNFSGALPSSLSPRLNVLDLSHNSFTGTIPTTLANLTRLAVLNLQNNSLSGPIPSDLNLPTTLRVLNFSYNRLNGSIPDSLKRFPPSSFLGNPLSVSSSASPSPSPSPSTLDDIPNPPSVSQSRHAAVPRKKLGAASIIAIVIGCLAFVFLLLVVILVRCLKRKGSDDGSGMVMKRKIEKANDFGSGVQEAEKNKLFFFQGCSYSFDLEDLLKASAEVLGKGSYGTTYKASLEEAGSQAQVVVKRLKEVGVGRREFEQHFEALDTTIGRHPNVVPLRAYYYSKDEKLLVYNYMPAGSLFSLLHGNRSGGRTPLDWDSRMKIALGTARGIAHIHREGGPKCSHGNIKSSNVLLTDELEGCVSDVGLAQLMNTPVTMSRVAGYRAPEVMETSKVTQKSDVYSFGVLVLEMLTAKAPVVQLQQGSSGQPHDEVVDLPRWVRSVVREEWTAEVFDVELLRFQSFQEEMVQMLQIGLACVARTPDVRPKMDQVVRMIEDIRQSDSKNRTSSEAEESNIQTP